MANIGITGGVGTGKSAVLTGLSQILRSQGLAVTTFSADFEARRLTEKDLDVLKEIRSVFGDRYFDESGRLIREQLRTLVFRDTEARQRLEQILHPRIRHAWLQLLSRTGFFLAEIPLLFETQAEKHFDEIVVTACSQTTQIERLVTGRRLPPALAEQMIHAQMPLSNKVLRADRVIWTDCRSTIADRQLQRLGAALIAHYGDARS